MKPFLSAARPALLGLLIAVVGWAQAAGDSVTTDRCAVNPAACDRLHYLKKRCADDPSTCDEKKEALRDKAQELRERWLPIRPPARKRRRRSGKSASSFATAATPIRKLVNRRSGNCANDSKLVEMAAFHQRARRRRSFRRSPSSDDRRTAGLKTAHLRNAHPDD